MEDGKSVPRSPAIAAAQALLAREIVRARLEAGLTRRQLADRAGVAYVTIVRLESGDHMPRPETIQKLEAVLDLRGL